MSRAADIAYAILRKEAGAGRMIAGAFRGLNRAGNALSRQLAEAGVKSEVAHLAAKVAPYVAAGWGAKKTWESGPVQRLRAKIKYLRGKEQPEQPEQAAYYQ